MAKRRAKRAPAAKSRGLNSGLWKSLNGNEVLLVGLAAVLAVLGIVMMVLKAL
ncbi:hypothetical protein HYV79_03430 [Candidatus Woesearchaeota archaeon]|nr:hypothetical protein [Candidatus Woesearchaeota archaeon]